MSTKHRFRPGDCVVVVEDPDPPFFTTYPELLGSVGYVVAVDSDSVGVDFHDGFLVTEEAKRLGLHDLMGKIPRSTGWFLSANELDFYEAPNDTVELLSGEDMENFLCM